jgi:hypothetical protein
MNVLKDNTIKLKSRKKKKFLIISSEEDIKYSFINKLIENNHLHKKRSLDNHEEVSIEYEYQNGKCYLITFDIPKNFESINRNFTGKFK